MTPTTPQPNRPRAPKPRRARMDAAAVARAAVLGAAAAYVFACALEPGQLHWVDSLNQLVHRAGHLLFGRSGELLSTLGGTLLQLIFPAAISLYVARRGHPFLAAIGLMWVAQSLTNISAYVRTAGEATRPFSAVEEAVHDWNRFLSDIDALAYDDTIATAIHVAGLVVLAAAVVLGARHVPTRVRAL